MTVDFRELGVGEPTLRSLVAMGFSEPTPVQAQAIPLLLAERDLIAQALTGTGKTAAFGVPIVERLEPGETRPQAIVLAPTRELALQVTDQLVKIGQHRRISVLPVYGGAPIWRQLEGLRRGVNVVVATPGRLLDHMRRGSIDLSGVRTLILDEADQMLEMGFIEDVETILEGIPTERVTGLFSATMPKQIVDLAQKHLREPERLQLAEPKKMTAPDIDQSFYLVPFPRKLEALCRVLDVRQPERAIVFCSTKRTVDDVVEALAGRGYLAGALHGDIGQAMRERVLRTFRAGKFEVLVATDVAARGLDVPEVSHVINFDIPPDPEYYVHRIGRTGRYGRQGVAITFVNPREMRILKTIEHTTGAQIRREEVPTAAEAEAREAEILGTRLLATLRKGSSGRYRPVIERLLHEEHDPIDLAAAALELLATSGGGSRRAERAESTPPPAAVPVAPAATFRQVPDRAPGMVPTGAPHPHNVRPTPAFVPRQHRDRVPSVAPVAPERQRYDRAPAASFVPDRQRHDRIAPGRAPWQAGGPARDAASDNRRPNRYEANQRVDGNTGRPFRDRADFDRRGPDGGETTNRPKKRVYVPREAVQDNRGGAGTGRKPTWDRRSDATPDREPRSLVKGAKSWERRPKPSAPTRPARPKRAR